MASGPTSGPLDEREEAAWPAMVRAVIVIPRLVEAGLMASSNLNLADFTVLANLSERPDRSMRMTELAVQVAMSASGLTRVVERLAPGLLERSRAGDDGRGQLARLTTTGTQRLEAAYPHHVETVRRQVLDHFDAVDLAALAAALNAVGTEDR